MKSIMHRRRVMIIVGTRPEAIKMAPVYLALKNEPQLDVCLVITGQHHSMLDQVLVVFGLKPDIKLDVMNSNQSLGELSTRLLTNMQSVVAENRPSAVLVHGDTTTCLFAALAAFYEGVPIGHVEAGLRTYKFEAPWPEEMNRRLVDPLCKWCFAPTERAARNLLSERIPKESIFVTGNTVVDSLLWARSMVKRNQLKIPHLPIDVEDHHRLILVTGHRRESFGKPLQDFCMGLRDAIRAHEDTILVYPVHLNPNVQQVVRACLDGHDRIFLIPPVSYIEMVYLLEASYMVITDSGGIQEEAPAFHKPVLVTRDYTERPEAIELGLAKIVGTSREKISAEVHRLLCDPLVYKKMSEGRNPYGDGQASKRITRILLETI